MLIGCRVGGALLPWLDTLTNDLAEHFLCVPPSDNDILPPQRVTLVPTPSPSGPSCPPPHRLALPLGHPPWQQAHHGTRLVAGRAPPQVQLCQGHAVHLLDFSSHQVLVYII
ncbi:hypothetical protein NEOLEDRAFT_237534 [Neolentinus lepideus HHB14362 ss-1]|uniref:Uncharacterized protein n=1 Tax=Neolentinus lepideus HHB14362 ss-1 TaxID=1314782 RepID=A0A165M9Y8_9AGAM|nr:hypothetical protein NEOLEDRAFT_237534 [Neolentinus lepideus HHB14362 ss-1]